jgi:predicted transposase YbfD/YdcC
METEGRLRLADVFVSIQDPRQAAKVEHDLVELLVVAVNAVLVGADTFVEIELWAKEKLDWLRGYLRLAYGIPSHDTFGRMFGLIDPEQFESAFRRWVESILPALGAEIVAIDGKTSRRSGGVDATALHLVSAFAAGAGLVLGQRATAEKSNEIAAIPELLSTLALTGCTVTIDAMGTQTAIAEVIRDKGADYVLAVKDNQPRLAESIQDFWRSFRAHPASHTPHSFAETVEKDHGRLETRRCYVFDQLECLDKPQQWPGCAASPCLNRSAMSAGAKIDHIAPRQRRDVAV